MNIERFCVKFLARPGTTLDDAVFIEVFHEWIRRHTLPGILLDVADYRHVPDGPGIMLITHEINFAMDYSEGGFGLLAQRKLGQGTTQQERILELVRATVTFGALLEADPRVAGQLSLEGGAFQFLSNDRLALPNTADGFAAIRPDLEATAAVIYPGQAVSVARLDNDPRDRLTLVVQAGTVDMQTVAGAVGALV
ncbi:MAG: hypothetical protein H6632_18815 [Anaerolineales bacterium]|nr:hypothetical protein [Anaerolineales bacterium]